MLPSVVEVVVKNNQLKPVLGILLERQKSQCWSVLENGHLLNHPLSSIRFTLATTDQILKEFDSNPYEPVGLSSRTRNKLNDIPQILGAIKDLLNNSLKREYINALPLNLGKFKYNIDELTREFQKIRKDNFITSKWATYQTILHSPSTFRILKDPLIGMEIECFSKEERDFYNEIQQEQINRFLEKITTKCNTWSEFDYKLIQILKKGVMASKSFPDINKTIAFDILRKTGNYSPKDSDLIVFLKESGLVAPWETFLGKYTNLKRISDLSIMEEEEVTKEFQETYSEKLFKAFETPKSNTSNNTTARALNQKYAWLAPVLVPGEINDMPVNDGCDNLRKDFGDLPVFIVDGTFANEIDDGFSIERQPDGVWIHVHIADPTAYLSANHPLSLFAQIRHSSIYFPNEHLPLIPHKLTEKLFNLGTSPFAITFSAKFQSNGDILDYKVQPSILRNIQQITYTKVSSMLEESDEQSAFSKDLKDVKKIMDKHLEYRSSQGALNVPFVGEIVLDPYPFKDVAKSWNPEPANYPRIHLNLYDDSNARNMVSECMIVAGRISARYFSENRIPALYRGQELPNLSKEDTQQFETILSKKDPKTGMLPLVESSNISSYFSSATLDTKPSIHFAMGLDKYGYLKISSPLRRYTDLMLHWNLKAFWSQSKYPFSDMDLASMISRMTIIEKEIKSVCKHVDRYWLFEWVRRRQVLYNHPEILKENGFIPHESQLGIPRSWTWTRKSDESLSQLPLYDAHILKMNHEEKYFKIVVPSFFNYTTVFHYKINSKEFFVGNKIKVRINRVNPGILDLKLDYVLDH